LIVNVQIRGLKDNKPQSGGASGRPGYEKYQVFNNSEKNTFNYFYVNRKINVKVKWRKVTGRTKTSVQSQDWGRTHLDCQERGEKDRSNGEKIRYFVIFKFLAKMLMISQVTRKMMVNIFKCGSNHTETIRVICMQSFGSMHERFGYVRKFNFNTNAFHLGSKVYWLNKRIIHLNVSVVNYIKTIVMNIYEKNKNNIYSIRCFIVKASGVNCRRVILNKVSFSINLWEKIRPKSLTLLARISTALILSLTIYLTLLKEGIEHQPGPPNSKTTLSILTYNCNGLGDSKKLKRVIMKSRRLVERGCIVMLQETHLVDTKYLDLIWKHNYLSNCMRTNSAGVIILFNKQYNLVNKIVDNDGRQIIAVVESDDNKIILVNAYFPNDHRQGVAFAENIYTKILEMQNKYPEYVTFFAGDMNICMSSNDSLNRIGSRNEDLVSDVIKNSNEIAEPMHTGY
jgi:hypothetical protein